MKSPFPLVVPPIIICSASALSSRSSDSTRRSFLSKASTVTAGLSFGLLVNINHSPSCTCGSCTIRIGPAEANADPVEKLNSLSPDFYAQDLEAKRTLSRLEKGGFKLDTDEERTLRLNDALSSFSYDTVTAKTKSTPRKSTGLEKDSSKRKKSDYEHP